MALLSLQFARFLLAGGTAAVANYCSRFLFSYWVDYELAIILAYMLGMFVAFVLMRRPVFQAQEGASVLQIAKFVGVNILAVTQTLLVSLILARWILPACGVGEHAEAWAHLVGVLIPVMTSYYGHKYLTFR
jgi:putative flippase GtrA